MRRSVIPILIIVCAFVAFSPLLREFFPLKLPAAELLELDIADIRAGYAVANKQRNIPVDRPHVRFRNQGAAAQKKSN